MRERRRRTEVAADVNITSLVDIFTALLLFLLAFIDPAIGAAPTLQLPEAAAVVAGREGVRVRLSAEGLVVDEVAVAAAELRGGAVRLAPGAVGGGGLVDGLRVALESRRPAAEDAGPPLLVLECDARAPYTDVDAVLRTARAAGYERFHFIVDRKGR